jgi:hypothetical protein
MPDHYAVIGDVNNLVPQAPFSASSKPTLTVVTSMIDDVANDMDAVLKNIGYVTPVVSGTLALQWLRKTCALGTLAIAQAARDTGVTTAVNASGREGKNIWQQLFDARMEALADPQDPTELPDAPRNNDQLLKQPESVLRSMVDGITDVDFSDSPEVQRDQVL